MLQPHEIKREDESPKNDIEKCTCKHGVEEGAGKPRKVRQILVNFGLNRKKVFTLSGKKVGLRENFISYILSEPAFSGLLEDSYVVFQEFCAKFDSWVDVDVNEKLRDGAVLNAIFFPSSIERDEANPGSIRKKEVQIVSGTSADDSHLSEIIDLDDDESVGSQKKKKSSKNSEIEEDKTVKKKRKSVKNNSMLDEEVIHNADESKPKKVKNDSKIKDDTKKTKQEEETKSAEDENSHFSPSRHLQSDASEAPKASNSRHPERADDSPGSWRSQERPSRGGAHRDSGRDFVSRNYDSYGSSRRRSAEFAAWDSPHRGPSRQPHHMQNGAYYRGRSRAASARSRGHPSRAKPHWYGRS